MSAVRRLLLTALILALVGAMATPVGAASAEEQRLQQTRARLAELRQEIEQASTQRERHAEALAEAEARVAEVMEVVQAAELAVQRQQQAVEAAREKLEQLRVAAREHRERSAERAVELYKNGTSAPLASVLAARSPQDVIERSAFVEVVVRADVRSFEEVEASQRAVDAQAAVLAAEEESLERVLSEQRALLVEVEALRDSRALALAETADQLAKLEQQEQHLEAESRELAALARRPARAQTVSRSGRGSAAAVPAVASGAGWTWPASGPVTSGYGPRWGRMHEGIDIGAGMGAAVVAARGGVVSFAGRMGGYGNMVLIDHGGGIMTAYAHQSAIAVGPGQRVSAGQRVGSVGCSGSCTGPHLHFEVRVHGAPRNPMGFLP